MDPLDTSHTAMKFAAPNPGDTADWYERVLGFKSKKYLGGDYAIVGRGKLVIHLWKCADRRIAENTSCYVELESCADLDSLHAQWHGQDMDGGRIEEAPKDQTGHGMREFHVWDPAGNLIGFGADLNTRKKDA